MTSVCVGILKIHTHYRLALGTIKGHPKFSLAEGFLSWGVVVHSYRNSTQAWWNAQKHYRLLHVKPVLILQPRESFI